MEVADIKKKETGRSSKKAKTMKDPYHEAETIISLNIRGRSMDVPHATLISVHGSLLHEWFSPPFPYAVARFKGRPYLNFDFAMFEQVIEVLTSKQWETMNQPHPPVPSPSYGRSFEGDEFLRMVDYLGLSEAIFPFGIFNINTGPEHCNGLRRNYTLLQRSTPFSSDVYKTFCIDKLYGNKDAMIKGVELAFAVKTKAANRS